MNNINLYKFNILSLIEYNNHFFKNLNIDKYYNFNIFELNLFKQHKFDIDLITDDYASIENYNNQIYELYKDVNNIIPSNIILLNLDEIKNNTLLILEQLYSDKILSNS